MRWMRFANDVGSSNTKPEVRSEVSKRRYVRVAHALVGLVLRNLLPKLLDDRVVGVELKSFLARHVTRHGRVAERLCLHDALHVGEPPELACDEHAWASR